VKRLLLVAVLVLSGCAVIFPKPHDPVMFDQIVGIQIRVGKVNCSNKDWGDLFDRVHHLKVYTELRDDPQSKAIGQLEEALLKAYNSKNEKFCESVLTLNKTRIAVVEDAWKGR
jgi:hypothetical protein